MDENQLRLDGNAVAGLLADLLAPEATQARARCGTCGSTAEVGAQSLYMYPGSPGAVLRCHSCQSVLMVIVRGLGHTRFSWPGIAWLDIPENAVS